MTTVTTAHTDALSKAKIALMARPDSTFFTTVVFSLKQVWNDAIPTARTNGKKIEFSPDFFLALTAEERVFLLLHEAMHCAYLHMDRLGERDARKWNIAADHVINLQLKERGFTMPESGLADPQYAGMSTDEVYQLLPADLPPPPMEDLQECEEPSDELREEIQEILVRAQLQSQMAGDKPGTIPGEIQIFLDRLLAPKLPWHRILAKYLRAFNKNDYSFRRANRRFFPEHHLPSLYSESLDDVVFAVDASGSVSDAEFSQFVSEITSTLRMMKPREMTLVTFDTAIRAVDRVRSLQELSRITFTGRGGTCIAPVLQWAEEKKPQVLLVFTDGYFRFYQQDCTVPVIWLVHDNPGFAPPFGKVIHYTIER